MHCTMLAERQAVIDLGLSWDIWQGFRHV